MASPPSSSSITTSSSSSRPSTSSHPSSSSSVRPNLPPPPPPSRLPPPKSRSIGHAAFKMKLGKGKERQASDTAGVDEEEWTLEGGSSSGARKSADLERASVQGGDIYDSQLTEVPERARKQDKARDRDKDKDKESKGRRLVKKTSQMFSRKERDRGREAGSAHGDANNDSQSNHSLPSAGSRQASFSSVTSGESSTSTGTQNAVSRPPFGGLYRPLSHSSRNSQQAPVHSQSTSRSPKMKHSRRISQDSQLSWHGLSRGSRSGSSSTESPPLPPDSNLPIPSRQASNLSASVPALSRNSLPPNGQQAVTSIPSRMSTWFSHLITSTPPDAANSSDPPSPARKPTTSAAATFLNAARQRAVDGVRHLLDTEAQPDKCQDVIWVMGVPHPGYRPPTPSRSPSAHLADLPVAETAPVAEGRRDSGSSGKPSPPRPNDGLRPAGWGRKRDSAVGPTSPPSKGFTQIFTGSTLSLVTGSPSKETPASSESPSRGRKAVPAGKEKEVLKWPEAFYDDFRSRVWCTYRSQYAPILSLPNNLLIPSPAAYYAAFGPPADIEPPPAASAPALSASLSSKPSSWGWSRSAEERGLTSDAGWGCMLRTGQSMLANALIHLHLGRDWRIPPEHSLGTSNSAEKAEYATYVRLLSYFLDDPSPLCPFSVHRMALIGKELGKEVGEWFGPSTAAGALKTLANSFPPCGLAVVSAMDGIIYRSDVYSASSYSAKGWLSEEEEKRDRRASRRGIWGKKAVLVLIGIRLGLDGVNPIYYDSIKALFTFPQSVGIAGGRPSSSYYFVASQANSLFYLDPHFTRPAIPLEIPPSFPSNPAPPSPPPPPARSSPRLLKDSVIIEKVPIDSGSGGTRYKLDVVDVDDVSDGDSEASLSPSKTDQRRGRRKVKASATKRTPTHSPSPSPAPTSATRVPSTPSTPIAPRAPAAQDVFTSTVQSTSVAAMSSHSAIGKAADLDAQTKWYLTAYSDSQLRTFHCEKVRKMPLSGLDPSMLLGFLCRDEADFEDFCERVNQLPQKIFSVQAEPPSWDDDDAAGLESVSEPASSEDDELPSSHPVVPGLDANEVHRSDIASAPSAGAEYVPKSKQPRTITEDDTDWDTPSISTLNIRDRADRPGDVPVMEERPEIDMPRNAIPASETIRPSQFSRLAESEEGGVNGAMTGKRLSGEREKGGVSDEATNSRV